MPLRKTLLATGECYHVFNRGIADQIVFRNRRDYKRFLMAFKYYQFRNVPFKLSKLLQVAREIRESHLSKLYLKNDKGVEVMAYCFMPNHFHLLIRQLQDRGISNYIRLAVNSYAKFFNTKYKRAGSLFQNMFKAVRIENDDQLLHVSRYIHLNPLVSYMVSREQLLSFEWSSLNSYLSGVDDGLLVSNDILMNFKKREDYLKFVLDQEDYGKELEKVKHLLPEEL